MDFDKLNKERKKYSIPAAIGLIIIACSFPFAFFVEENSTGAIAMIVAIAVGILIALIAMVSFKKFKNNFKKDYLEPIIRKAYPECEYSSSKGLPANYVAQSRVIHLEDTYRSEDLLSGEFEDVKFSSCDVHIQRRETHYSNGHTETTYVTTFLGRFFEFEFNKEFKYDLIVKEKGDLSINFDLHKVKLESVEFNKKFKTFAQNDSEAFYILTPQIMERLLQIEAKYRGHCSFSFVHNKFYFALNNNKDTFSVQIFKKIDDNSMSEFKDEVNMIKEIINTLKLNINIFK